MSGASLNTTGENLLRELAPQVLGVVIRRFGDFGAAEDAVQEALLAARTGRRTGRSDCAVWSDGEPHDESAGA